MGRGQRVRIGERAMAWDDGRRAARENRPSTTMPTMFAMSPTLAKAWRAGWRHERRALFTGQRSLKPEGALPQLEMDL